MYLVKSKFIACSADKYVEVLLIHTIFSLRRSYTDQKKAVSKRKNFWVCAFAKLRKAIISFVFSVYPPVGPSVRMEQLAPPPPSGRIFMKFYIWIVFRNSDEKIQV